MQCASDARSEISANNAPRAVAANKRGVDFSKMESTWIMREENEKQVKNKLLSKL